MKYLFYSTELSNLLSFALLLLSVSYSPTSTFFEMSTD